eukprot:6218522-Amphidinium_carterae.1
MPTRRRNTLSRFKTNSSRSFHLFQKRFGNRGCRTPFYKGESHHDCHIIMDIRMASQLQRFGGFAYLAVVLAHVYCSNAPLACHILQEVVER